MLPLVIVAIENDSDRTLVTDIYLQYRHAMYCMIRKMIQKDQDTEDIINEAIICLIKNIATIRNLNEYSLRKYVMSTTKTTTINYLSKRKIMSQYAAYPQDDSLDNIPAGEEQDIEKTLIQLFEIQKLKDALKKLPAFEYEVLFMREYDGLTDSEIACIIGKKENSVRSYASRAYKHARELLAR